MLLKKGNKTKKVKTKNKSVKQKKPVIKDLEGNVIRDTNKEKKKKFGLRAFIKKHRKKISIVVACLLLILLIVLGYILIRNYLINKKYKPYQEKMEAYGLALMYDNESANSSDKVTKTEMVKVILSAIYNTTEVSSIGFSSQGKFDGDDWVTTAIAFSIIEKDSVTEENYDKSATYGEALMTILNARSEELDIPVSSTKEASFKNLQSYNEKQRSYINDAVENELIENSKKKINLDKDLIKGELNELVVKLVEKYNTIVPEGETIVVKEESKPDNAEIYPYILYSVSPEVYEYEPVKESGFEYNTPVEVYKHRRDYYDQIEYRTEQYYNTILNVNYNDISLDKFKEEARTFLRYLYEDTEFSAYVDYVKNNKIIIEGKSEVQFPIFYLDGIRFRARVKLTFNIKNSNTDKNLLFGDLTRPDAVTYKNKEYTVYIDAPMGTSLLSEALRLDKEPIIDILVSDKKARELNEM